MKISAYEFWNRFDRLRGETEIQDIVSKTDMKYRTLLSMRTNQSIPKAQDLLDLAKALGVSMEYLLTGKKESDLFPDRIMNIAKACAHASNIELTMVEKILDIAPAGKNTVIQMTS